MNWKRRFQRKPEIQDRVEKLSSLFDKYERGDTLLWTDVEKATGFPRDDNRTIYAFKRAKRDLRDGPRGIELLYNGVDGFKFLTVKEQLEHMPKLRDRKAITQCNLKAKGVCAVPDENLTEHQRRLVDHHMRSADEVRMDVLRRRRESERIMAPTESIPQRPRGA